MEIKHGQVLKVASYNATPEKIWHAITDKNQMKEWYFDIPDFELKVGKIFNFYEPGEEKKFHHRCKIIEIIHNKKLSHTWTYPSHSKGESILTWEINPENDKTKVFLRHDHLESFADGGKDFARENFEAGWKELLEKSLRLYLEKSTHE